MIVMLFGPACTVRLRLRLIEIIKFVHPLTTQFERASAVRFLFVACLFCGEGVGAPLAFVTGSWL